MKVKIALFFSILFMSLIVAPTIITLIDDNQDISYFFDLTEEEENNTKEGLKELKIYSNIDVNIFFKKIKKRKNVIFNSKNYTSLYLKISTPPPELPTLL
ncbi:hypothetical protein PG913_11815 [Tenacibaculum pacificus]|uniref:hypothetical protein n=1 Tax=Tenacibaculum pacificus TaxID=3018314 RepID=UPI0022F3AECA|nr:hypothetical protein [Tenacibaculum pacificus]WBX73506.1 hypothetical protein PG913_11815 [Tenacibaculum pacificus]